MRISRSLDRVSAAVLIASNVFLSPVQAQGTPTATIQNGTINGVYNGEFNQDFFLGIPFGRAPRLTNPEPLDTQFNGTFEATQYGATCYGFGSNQLLNFTQSEDCLNLNVIRPSGTGLTSLPVLLWIYGGGFRQGSSADPMWNLSYITNQSIYQGQPILTVSINYRLSFLGFPGGQEALDAGVTNLGLKDQRLALQWVQENIASFGGDPHNVTVWGESAGAASIAMHLISEGGQGSAGLFRSAILVSGFETGINPSYANKTQTGYDSIVANANCTSASDTLQCLREAPLSTIYPYEDTTPTGWNVVIDGSFVQREPALEVQAGHVTRVPIILGANSDEGLFVVNTLQYFPNTTAELTTYMRLIFPTLPNATLTQIVDAYPQNASAPPYSLPPDFPWCAAMHKANLACGTQYRREAAIFGDFFSAAPRRYMARHWAKLGLPAYSFRFDTNPTALPIVYWNGLGPGFALHGAELAYEFGLPPGFTTPLDFYPPVKDVPTHARLSLDMISRWISFAYSGNPNDYTGLGTPEWPEYSKGAQNYVFNATDAEVNVHVEKDDYRDKAIQIWNDNVLVVNYGTSG